MRPLIRFAYKNLIHSKIRSGLSVLAVLLGVLLITTLLMTTDALVAAVDDSLDLLSGVLVVQQEDAVDPNFSIIDRNILNELNSANQSGGPLDGKISGLAEEIWYTERSDTGVFGFLQIIGVHPDEERETVGILHPRTIVDGRTLTEGDYNATVIGYDAAEIMNLQTGDFVETKIGKIPIVGVFKTDSFIDSSLFVPFELAQQFSEQFKQENFISTILVKPISFEFGDEIKEFVDNTLGQSYDVEASDFEEIAEQGRKFLKITTDFAFYIGLISVIIGSLSVFNAILMSVMERKKEIAILKATGWSDKEVGIEVFVESLLIAVLGGAIGLIGGIFLCYYVTSVSKFLDFVILPWTLIQSFVYAVVLGLCAGLYPAFRAMRIDPVEDLTG